MKPKRNPLYRGWLFPVVLIALTGSASQASTIDVPAGSTEQLTTLLEIGEGLVKTGDGTLICTVDQFINDDVVVNGGTLIFNGGTDPEATSPSFVVNDGKLMLGGDAFAVPVVLNGGTLVIGAQRTTTIDSFDNARNHILGNGDTHQFAPYDGHYWYPMARAAGNPEAEALGIPDDGLITSLLDGAKVFQVKINGNDNANVNSHEWGNHRRLVLNAADRRKYAAVDILVSNRGGSSNPGLAVYNTYTDQGDTNYNSLGATGAMPLNPLLTNSNTAFSGGRVATDGTTFDTDNLMHMYAYRFGVDPARDLWRMSFLRNGGSGATNLVFAVSGMAVNEVPFASDIEVNADATLDLAGAPVVGGNIQVDVPSLTLRDDWALTVTRDVPDNRAFRAVIPSTTLVNGGGIEVLNSPGGGAGFVNLTGLIAGDGGLYKSGPGNLGLTAANTYSGQTDILQGTVFLNHFNGLGSANDGTSLYSGATLFLLNGAHNGPIAEPLTAVSGGRIRSGNGFEYTLTGPVSLQAAMEIETDGGTTIQLEGDVTGSGTIAKTGSGVLVLAGDNSFGSGTMVFGSGQNNRGHIRIESDTALGDHDVIDLASQQAGVSGLQLADGVTVGQDILTRGRSNATTAGYILRSLSGNNAVNGDITINAGGGSYAIVCDDGTLTLNGTLSSNVASSQFGPRLYTFTGDGDIVVNGKLEKGGDFSMQNLNVTKEGNGTLTLAGTNDYTGITNLVSGTTVLSGSIAESAIVSLGTAATLDVSSHGPAGYAFGTGQTLRGTGTLLGTASTAGTVSPGLSAGTLAVNGGFTFEAGSNYLVDIDTLGTAQVETATAAGTAAADGNVAVTVTGAGIAGSPVTLDVPILNNETPAAWAAKVRTALAATPAINTLYEVGGINEQITLTRLSGAASDATLNIALANGDPDPGITPAPTSANTTAGIAPGNDTLAVTGALTISGATLDLAVTGTPAAPAYVIATYGSLTGTFAAVNNLPAGYSIDYGHNSGTAIALVSGAPADNFATWAAANGIAGQPFNGDFDGDGIPNGMEYALAGLDPTAPGGFPGSFANGTLSFAKRPEAVDNGDVSYAIETSTTLQAGSWTPVTPDVDDDTTISYVLPAGQGKIFARLVVTPSP